MVGFWQESELQSGRILHCCTVSNFDLLLVCDCYSHKWHVGGCHVWSFLCYCSLSVRGLKSDSAVLCTDNESFEVKEAETSNSLLLLPQCQFTAQSLNCCAQPSAVNRQVLTTLTIVSALLQPVVLLLDNSLLLKGMRNVWEKFSKYFFVWTNQERILVETKMIVCHVRYKLQISELFLSVDNLAPLDIVVITSIFLLTTLCHTERVVDGCYCYIRHRACQAACTAGGWAFITEQRLVWEFLTFNWYKHSAVVWCLVGVAGLCIKEELLWAEAHQATVKTTERMFGGSAVCGRNFWSWQHISQGWLT